MSSYYIGCLIMLGWLITDRADQPDTFKEAMKTICMMLLWPILLGMMLHDGFNKEREG